MQHKGCAVCSCPAGPTDSQLIMSKSERRASLLPLAHLAAWWLLLICPQASVSTSPIWTGIKGPNTNSCAEISHVSIYSYFVNQRTTHSAQIMNCYICISLFSYTWLWIPFEKHCIYFYVSRELMRWQRIKVGTNVKSSEEATSFVSQNVPYMGGVGETNGEED